VRIWRTSGALDHISREVLGGSLVSMGLRIGGLGLSYGANIFLSRLLGLHGYGQYVVALGWTLVLTLPARAGFENASLRYVTIYLERGEAGPLRGFIRVAIATVVTLSVLMGAAVAVLGQVTRLGTADRAMTAAALLILPLALLGIISPMMRTARRIFASQFYDQILRPLLLILLLGMAAVIARPLTVPEALVLTAAAAVLALGALGIHFRRIFGPATRAAADYSEWRPWFALSLPLLVIGATQELMNQMEVLLLGMLAGASDAALFAAAWRLASLTPFALSALTAVGGPLIASAYERGARDELHHVSKLVARVGLGFALLASVILLIWGRWLLGLFGPEFPRAYTVVAVLLVGGLVNAFTGIVGYLMVLTGRERPALAIFAGSMVLSIGLNLVLIPRFGAIGAAVASSSATAAWNLAMLVYIRRAIGIDASAMSLSPIGK
jgi:O-antigen/teichoic acid export membrane protein